MGPGKSLERKETKDENYWHGIKRFAGDDEGLPNFDKEIQEHLDHKGGKPWIDLYKNEHSQLTQANVRATADAIRYGTIDATDATKAGITPPASYYTLEFQTILRATMEREVYSIVFQATKDDARLAVEEIAREDGHLVRAKLYSLWEKLDTAHKQQLTAIFQAGISNPDGKTKINKKDNIKKHIERLLHLQSSIRDETPLAQRSTNDILKPGTAWTIIRASLPAIYGPTLAAFDDTLNERDLMNAALVAAGNVPMAVETDVMKFGRLRTRIHNFYEAMKREWDEDAEEEADESTRTPALFVSPPAQDSAVGYGYQGGKGGGKGGYRGNGKGAGWNINYPPTNTDMHVEQCFNYTHTGTCRFGAQCRNRHDPPGTPAETDRRPQPKCWGCKGIGHLRKDCPNQQHDDQARPPAKRPRTGDPLTALITKDDDNTSGHDVQREIFDFISNSVSTE